MPYSINGMEASMSEPNLQEGTLWVPLRGMIESLGGNVDWDADNRVAVAYLGANIATLTEGDVTADVNGEQTEMQAAPTLQDGEMWVPVRFFNLVGQQVSVDTGTNQVDITSVA